MAAYVTDGVTTGSPPTGRQKMPSSKYSKSYVSSPNLYEQFSGM